MRETEEEQGAGDQGIMFGYACSETKEFMPASLILAQVILKELAVIRREGKEMTYLRPDSKSQVTIEYGDDKQSTRSSFRRSTTNSSGPTAPAARKRRNWPCARKSEKMSARS